MYNLLYVYYTLDVGKFCDKIGIAARVDDSEVIDRYKEKYAIYKKKLNA